MTTTGEQIGSDLDKFGSTFLNSFDDAGDIFAKCTVNEDECSDESEQ